MLRRRLISVWTLAAAIFTLPGPSSAQQRAASPHTLLVSGTAATEIPSELIREIDDPSNGDRWLLERDPANPAGPGRLVRIRRASATPASATPAASVAPASATPALSRAAGSSASPSAYLPVIHAGDRLIVEQNTPLIEARLEAVALNPAEAGGSLRVRLEIGGNVYDAVAIAPGRAELAPETGARP